MILKGQPAKSVTYLPSDLAFQSAGLSAEALSSRMPPYYASYQYSVQNLDPGESFSIRGLYGDNWFALHTWEILGVIIVLIVIGIFAKLFHLGTRIKELFINPKKTRTSGHVYRPAKRVHRHKHEVYEFSFGRPIVAGIVSAFLFVFVSFLLQFFFQFFQYGFWGYDMFIGVAMMILMFIILFALPLIAIFGPAIYVGHKYGWREGLLTFIISVILAFVFVSLLAATF